VNTPTSPTTGPILLTGPLFFSYRGLHVFNGESFAFGAGLTWLRGANGSGKSTLLKLLGGVLDPAGGSPCVTGIDASRQPLQYRRQVFWCGPGETPFGHLRPAEYFGFLSGLYPSFDASALPAHLEGLGLLGQMTMPIQALSTGTQRKVWLTAALVAGTAAVLLDEPLNALDAESLAYVRRVLSSTCADTHRAWIVASHEIPCEGTAAPHEQRLGQFSSPGQIIVTRVRKLRPPSGTCRSAETSGPA
jgi:ABC-type multidrug transport system ATPase subunit